VSGGVTSSTANVAVSSGGSALSVSVPATVDVVQTGGVNTITVSTVSPVGAAPGLGAGAGVVPGVVTGSMFSGPVAVVGTLNGGVLSFSVGGAVTAGNNLVPGNYKGVLTVIASYN
jgi:hypothetical protein